MHPKEYEKNVLITESNDMVAIKNRVDDRMIRLLHAGLGMSSELAELADAVSIDDPEYEKVDWINVMEESGDLAWYVAVAVNALGFDHEEISSAEGVGIELITKHSDYSIKDVLSTTVWAVGNYNDLLKKGLFYGRELDVEKMKKTLKQICMGISGLCMVSGYTIEEARQTNINKLKARYGEKFTEAAALNRNLESERTILENK